MAIGDKKQILRGMHERMETEVQAQGEPGQPVSAPEAAAQIDKKLEGYMRPFVMAVLYLPFVLGLLALSWVLYGHWHDGVTFRSGLIFTSYFTDTVKVVAMLAAAIVLGLGVMFMFRETLTAKRRWWAFGFLMALVPVGIVAAILMPVCYYQGRAAAYRRMDFAALVGDAREMRGNSTFDPGGGAGVHEIRSFQSEYSAVPHYTRDVLNPEGVYIHDRGVTLQMGSTTWERNREEGLAIPLYAMTAEQVRKFALDQDLKVLSTNPPVFIYEDRSSNFPPFYAPGATTAPVFWPGSFRR